MRPLTRAESREVDRHASDELGVSSIVLMENAARGAVEVLLSQKPTPRKVLILCGKGNNGGDGFAMARHLVIRGIAVQVVLLARADELTGDAQVNFRIVQRLPLPLAELADADNLPAALDELVRDADWIVDALLGTGAGGDPREPFRTAIRWVNQHPAPKLAVDLPSGLDCDSGEPSVTTVRADVTCTFHAPKVGFLQPMAQEFLGELHVVSIGIPAGID